MNQPASHDEMRSANMLRIFNCIRKNGPITKKEIQTSTRLSWGCVSSVCADLLERKIVCEEKVRQAGAGRTPSGLRVNDEDYLLIGLDVDLGSLVGVVTDLASHVQICDRCPITDRNAKSVLRQMRLMTKSLLQQVPPNAVKGIAISSPGHMDASGRGSVWEHLFGIFDSQKLRRIFEEEFSVRVLLEHDPNCMAAAEHILGAAKDVDDFLFIRLSLGIDMAIMSDGRIYKGQSGKAGELGHMKMNPRGERCHCGNYGCLETFSSIESILRRCTEAAYAGKAPFLRHQLGTGRQFTLETAAAAARNGDTVIKNIFVKAAHYAGIAVANAVNLLDPKAVVLGGELAEYEDIFLNRLRMTVKSHVWSGKIDLRTAQLDSQSAAVGAASLLVQPLFCERTE